MIEARGTRTAASRVAGPTGDQAATRAVAAATLLLSAAALIYLSLAVPGYIRPDWSTAFAFSGVPCIAVGVLLLVRRRLSGAGIAAAVLFGDVAIVLSAFASADRTGTTAGALLGLPTLFTATFLRPRWLAAQVTVAAVCAWVVNSLVPASTGVHVIRTAVLVVACASPALIVVVLRRQLDRAVVTDPLTGLMNRRGLEVHLPVQSSRARRQGVPLAVLIIDIDHFKQINDRLGHLAGDQVLRGVASAVTVCVRPEDLVVRLGGEEIMVLLAAAPDDVRAVADRVRSRVAGVTVPARVTVSVGVAWSAPDRDDRDLLDHLVHQADERMYEAKRAGRDRVVFPPGP